MHTPGPWRAEKEKWDIAIIDDDNEYVAYVPANELILGAYFMREVPANARLIAAAPELLAALERLVLAFDVGDMAHTTVNGRGYAALAEARQAIAKAEGDTNE